MAALPRSLLVANRGEIVVRIARTARRLGIETVAIASDADRDAPHVRACDRVVDIGGERAADSYLRADRIVAAALAAGADAVHPGYGFLSENAGFAEAVLAAGLAWIGPPPGGDARHGRQGRSAPAPGRSRACRCCPATTARHRIDATLQREAARIGWPLMVKAAAGGGGRGMRLVERAGELDAALDSAALGSRSGLRRRAPAARARRRATRATSRSRSSPTRTARSSTSASATARCSGATRSWSRKRPRPPSRRPCAGAWARSAVAVAREVGYRGAGTVEFLLDAAGDFWFIEMNTRLQVEHAVTEALLGVDLVEWQLRVAAGEPLPMTQDRSAAPLRGRRPRDRGAPVRRRPGARLSAAGRTHRALVRAAARALRPRAGERHGRQQLLRLDARQARCARAHPRGRRAATGRGARSHGLPRRRQQPRLPRAGVAPPELSRGRGNHVVPAHVLPGRRVASHAPRPRGSKRWPPARSPSCRAITCPRPGPAGRRHPRSAATCRSSTARPRACWHLEGTRDTFDARSDGATHRIAAIHARHLNAQGGEIDASVDGRQGPRDLRPRRRHELVARRRRRDRARRCPAARPHECGRVRARATCSRRCMAASRKY